MDEFSCHGAWSRDEDGNEVSIAGALDAIICICKVEVVDKAGYGKPEKE